MSMWCRAKNKAVDVGISQLEDTRLDADVVGWIWEIESLGNSETTIENNIVKKFEPGTP